MMIGHQQSVLNHGFMDEHMLATPFLDSLSAHSITMSQGYVLSDDYLYNHRSLLSGVHPAILHEQVLQEIADEMSRKTFKNRQALEDFVSTEKFKAFSHENTIPKILRQAGYTSIFIGNEKAFDVSASGFDHSLSRNNTVDKSFLPVNKPIFLYATTAQEQRSTEVDTNLKIENIRTNDDFFSNVIRDYRKNRANRKAIILYMTDGGLFNGKNLMYRTPILFSMLNDDDIKKGGSKVLFSAIDVMPTLLEFLNIEQQLDQFAISQKNLLINRQQKARTSIIGKSKNGYWIRNHNFFFLSEEGKKEIYELNYDPSCQDNMIDYHPAKTRRYLSEIDEFQKLISK